MTSTPSLWPHLLTSNASPQDNEACAIRQGIVRAEHKITKLAKIAGPLPAIEKELYNFRQIPDLIDFVDNHKAIVSLLRTLPPELLDERFLHIVPPPNLDNGTKSRCIRPLFIPQPYAISQVSHSWREAALSTPSLWANIHLNEKDVHSTSDLHLLGLNTHLERSRQSPLHLSIKSR